MGMHLGRSGNSRSVRSRLGTALGLGSAAAMILAGVALVGVLPASAATATLAFSTQPPATATLNQPISFAVTISGGGAASDTITISSSNCTLVNNSTLTGTYDGTPADPVSFSGVKISAGTSCTLIATDTPSGGVSSASSAITMTAFGSATKLGFSVSPPTTSTAAAVLTTFKVSTEDTYGNIVTSAPVDSIVISSSCTVGGTTNVPEVTGTGTATFSAVTINSVGSCPLIATDVTAPDTGLTPATFSSVVVSGGAPEKLAFSVAPPATVAAIGTVVTAFKVSVEDVNGNVDTTSTGSADVVSLSSPCLAASVSQTAVAGVATFAAVEFATTGDCVLTATDTTHTIVAATATTVVGTAQAAITVTTKSGYLDVPLTLAASGGSGTGAITFSATNGTATGCVVTSGTLKATKAGTCLVTATKAAVAPYAPATSVATTVTISGAPHAVKLAGTVRRTHKETVTVSGYNFSGRPKVSSNVSGFSALITRDTGRTLWITITIKTSASKPGVKVLTLAFANGTHTSVRYSLH
jgi:hypothetical protein